MLDDLKNFAPRTFPQKFFLSEFFLMKGFFLLSFSIKEGGEGRGKGGVSEDREQGNMHHLPLSEDEEDKVDRLSADWVLKNLLLALLKPPLMVLLVLMFWDPDEGGDPS